MGQPVVVSVDALSVLQVCNELGKFAIQKDRSATPADVRRGLQECLEGKLIDLLDGDAVYVGPRGYNGMYVLSRSVPAEKAMLQAMIAADLDDDFVDIEVYSLTAKGFQALARH